MFRDRDGRAQGCRCPKATAFAVAARAGADLRLRQRLRQPEDDDGGERPGYQKISERPPLMLSPPVAPPRTSNAA
jgi:hypothetical protein